MIYPSADTIEDKVKSRYSLVILSAKRAKQIKEGAPILIDTASTNPLTIALEEIAAGKVTATEAEGELVPQASPNTSAVKASAGGLTTTQVEHRADKMTMEEPGDDDAEGA